MGPFPAFRLWVATREATAPTSSPWVAPTVVRPGLMPVISVGCTRLPSTSETCLDYLPRSDIGEGLSSVHATLALRSGLAVPPAAPITARLGVTPAAAPKLRVINADPVSGGLTVNTGGTVNKVLFNAQSLPGTPVDQSFAEADQRLSELSTTAPATTPPALPALTPGERMFVSIFGVRREAYKEQPGLRICASPCSAGAINTLLTNNPNRIIWVEGDLTLGADIGTAATPVLLIVDGDTLTLGGGVDVVGFVYLTGGSAAGAVTVNLPDGATSITGALVSETSLATLYAGSPSAADELTVTYDPLVLNTLRTSYGSWVRLGGGWRDFKANP